MIEAYNVNSGGNDYVYDSLGRITQYEGVGQTNNTTFPAFARKNSGYTYDANGNAKSRAGRTLTWDVQNRLKEVKNGSTVEESYLYDPDGQRVKKTAGSSNLYYPFTHYEIAGSTVTKYYFFAGQRIAMNKGGTLTYLHSDHLGSTVLTTQGSTTVSQQYCAYGRKRTGSSCPGGNSLPTGHTFTGQKLDGTGLQYYNARYYDPTIGAFISPDTIVPDAGNLFDYNRYMYVRGRVLNMNDPSGNYSNDEITQHFGCDSWSCVEGQFNEGGSLEGAWGWLNVLQDAQDGDTVTSTMLASIEGHPGSINSALTGSFLRGDNGRIGIHLETFVGADNSQSPLDAVIDGDALAQFARNGDYGMYGIKGRTTYGRDAKAACYTAGQCATQTLDAVSTGASAIAAVCLGTVVGTPCAGAAGLVSAGAGAAGTVLTGISAYQGEASWWDVGVGIATTSIGGVGGTAGKGTVGVTSSLFQWWWDQ